MTGSAEKQTPVRVVQSRQGNQRIYAAERLFNGSG